MYVTLKLRAESIPVFFAVIVYVIFSFSFTYLLVAVDLNVVSIFGLAIVVCTFFDINFSNPSPLTVT